MLSNRRRCSVRCSPSILLSSELSALLPSTVASNCSSFCCRCARSVRGIKFNYLRSHMPIQRAEPARLSLLSKPRAMMFTNERSTYTLCAPKKLLLSCATVLIRMPNLLISLLICAPFLMCPAICYHFCQDKGQMKERIYAVPGRKQNRRPNYYLTTKTQTSDPPRRRP